MDKFAEAETTIVVCVQSLENLKKKTYHGRERPQKIIENVNRRNKSETNQKAKNWGKRKTTFIFVYLIIILTVLIILILIMTDQRGTHLKSQLLGKAGWIGWEESWSEFEHKTFPEFGHESWTQKLDTKVGHESWAQELDTKDGHKTFTECTLSQLATISKIEAVVYRFLLQKKT